jgi:hypothetical protein
VKYHSQAYISSNKKKHSRLDYLLHYGNENGCMGKLKMIEWGGICCEEKEEEKRTIGRKISKEVNNNTGNTE